MGKYVLALDQGTTSSRCILFDKSGRIENFLCGWYPFLQGNIQASGTESYHLKLLQKIPFPLDATQISLIPFSALPMQSPTCHKRVKHSSFFFVFLLPLHNISARYNQFCLDSSFSPFRSPDARSCSGSLKYSSFASASFFGM